MIKEIDMPLFYYSHYLVFVFLTLKSDFEKLAAKSQEVMDLPVKFLDSLIYLK